YRSPGPSLSCVALSGDTDQREHSLGANRNSHNHYVTPQVGRVAPASSVHRCSHALAAGHVVGPSIRLLRGYWRHLRNGRVHATCFVPKAHFFQAYTYALSINPKTANGRPVGNGIPDPGSGNGAADLRAACDMGDPHVARGS